MKEIICKTENKHKYRILIQNGLRNELDKMPEVFDDRQKIVIITDKNVGKYYLANVKKQLRKYGGEVYAIVIKPGEASKSLAETEEIYFRLQELNFTRKDLIVALGGGVVGDLSGFVAATYLRGVDFIQIPTSLLAQVDSSVGGKTGVDLGYGKNLVGAFHQPEMVIIDPEFLDTLPDEWLTDGMGEVIKYGCISSSKLFLRLMSFHYQEDLMDDMEEIVAKCVTIKRNIVESDEMEQGIRRILNFGHTIGHVVESYFEFERYSHGQAVAIGMYQITKMSVREGITPPEALDNLQLILETYGLPWQMPQMETKRVLEILANDKKSEGDTLNICIMPKIGRAEIVKIKKDQALELFK
ncbi:MAG: 3-dehydroquinate synthase [Eubacteriaceae bacterium]